MVTGEVPKGDMTCPGPMLVHGRALILLQNCLSPYPGLGAPVDDRRQAGEVF